MQHMLVPAMMFGTINYQTSQMMRLKHPWIITHKHNASWITDLKLPLNSFYLTFTCSRFLDTFFYHYRHVFHAYRL